MGWRGPALSRVPLVPINSDDEEIASVFRRFRDEGREPIALYRALANAPTLLRAYNGLATALRYQSSTPRALRELGILRIAKLTRSRYEWSHHVPMAQAAGVPAGQIASLENWRTSDEFDERERALLRAADEVHACSLSDEAFAELERHFSERETTELLLLLAFYEMVARLDDGLAIEVEPEYEEHP
jgi:alkylhydroperoxidase family enzyme